MNFKNLLNRKAVIEKPQLIKCILSSMIVILPLAFLLTVVLLPSINEIIYKFSNVSQESISDFLWEIKDYAEDGITDEEKEKIISGAIRQTLNERTVIVEINDEEIVNLTNSYLYSIYENEDYNRTFIVNEWDEEVYDTLEEINEYKSKSKDFILNFMLPEFNSGYYNPETNHLILEKVDLYSYKSFTSDLDEKFVRSYDFLPSDYVAPEGYVHINGDSDSYKLWILDICGDIKYPMQDIYESDDLKIVITYDYQLAQNSVNYRMTIVYTAILLAVILLSVFVGIIRYYRNKSIYAAFEYRRKTTNAMAHDLKTPLSIVSLSVANLKDFLDKDSSQVRYHADEIDESVVYLNSLIGNILEFSKSEDSNYKITKTEVDVRKEIEKHVADIDKALESRNLNILVSGDTTRNTDIKLWNQAMNNLIDNAVRYASPKSEVRISLDKKSVSVSNSVEKDIDVTNLKEAFVKGDNSRGENSGSGLGLAVVDNNLKKLGYKLEISCKDKSFTALIK